LWRWARLLLAAALAACVNNPPSPQAPGARLVLAPVAFGDLPGWSEDNLVEALPALKASCAKLAALAPESGVGPGAIAGRGRDWAAACRDVAALPADSAAARNFFERNFRAYRLADAATGDRAFLTGYFQPEVAGARRPRPGFAVPLYRRPEDLVEAPLGEATAGRLVEGKLQPYYNRAEIDAGALSRRGLELVWLADPIDAFFVSIQGSALVELAEGGVMAIGVAGTNGRAYVAIGRGLVASGRIPADKVSLQTIRAWLRAHPDEARSVMESNPRYVFFRDAGAGAPIGSAGVPLTPGRSLAVDPAFLPLGAPIYIDSSDAQGQPLRRLTMAQDTGGAIKGPLRVDFFWGAGDSAEAEAGAMQSPGRLYLLLPRGVRGEGG
jgi:membrane-bound lytic murein transglycosylase A